MVFQFFWGPLKEKEKSRLLQDILKIGNTFYRYTGRLSFLPPLFIFSLSSQVPQTEQYQLFLLPHQFCLCLLKFSRFAVHCDVVQNRVSFWHLFWISSFQSSFSWFLITFPNACFHYIDIQSRVCFWHLFFIRSTLLSMLLFHVTTMLRLFTTIFLLWREDLIEPAIK